MPVMTAEKETVTPPPKNAPAPETPAPSFRDALRVVAFRRLWLGQAISQFGDALYFLVFVFMAEKLTGDSRIVGIVGVAQTLPFLLLSLHAGVAADRADRRRIMLASDLVSTGILLLFAVLLWFEPRPHTGYLIAAASLLSVANVFFSPAKGAAIPQLVPPHLLSVANGLSLATQSIMPMAGLALSGTVLTLLYAFSPAYFFLGAILLNALSFVVSAAFLALLPPLPPTKERREGAPDGERGGDALPSSAWVDLKSGLAYIKSCPALAAIVWLGMLVQGAVAPFMVVYVTVNSRWFGGAYWTLALCESGFFLGMVIGGAVASRIPVRRPGMAFIIGTAIIGATIAAMAFSRWYPLFVLWNFVAGLFVPYSQLPILNYIQRTTPNEFQGRVNSVLSLAAIGIQPLAIGLGGLALSAIGPVALLIIMGIGMAVAALGGLLSPSFRRAETPKEMIG